MGDKFKVYGWIYDDLLGDIHKAIYTGNSLSRAISAWVINRKKYNCITIASRKF